MDDTDIFVCRGMVGIVSYHNSVARRYTTTHSFALSRGGRRQCRCLVVSDEFFWLWQNNPTPLLLALART
eukprot:scaffold9369_cov182-Amphora_coffeaeformis.AAC.8